jgi:hypothetical protein
MKNAQRPDEHESQAGTGNQKEEHSSEARRQQALRPADVPSSRIIMKSHATIVGTGLTQVNSSPDA